MTTPYTHGFSTSTNAHGATCPTCGHDAAALLREIERLRQRVFMLERHGVDPWPATSSSEPDGAVIAFGTEATVYWRAVLPG